jgi:hypothetical protein
MSQRDEIIGQLPPGLSAGEWRRQGEELLLSLAAGEQQASMELQRPNSHRRAAATIMAEYVENLRWLDAQQSHERRRKTRRSKRGGRL